MDDGGSPIVGSAESLKDLLPLSCVIGEEEGRSLRYAILNLATEPPILEIGQTLDRDHTIDEGVRWPPAFIGATTPMHTRRQPPQAVSGGRRIAQVGRHCRPRRVGSSRENAPHLAGEYGLGVGVELRVFAEGSTLRKRLLVEPMAVGSLLK
jgi:hypothetical protein